MKTIELNNRIPFEQRTGEITLEELRELDSFKDYDEKQAAALLQTMKTFAAIVYNLCQDEGNNETTTIDITSYQKQNKAA